MERVKDFIRQYRLLFQITLPIFLLGKWFHKVLLRIRGTAPFYKNLRKYNKLNKRATFKRLRGWDYRIKTDWYEQAGSVNAYFWQDLWAARLINQKNPRRHYDIGSRIDGFIANLATHRDNIVLLDIRPFDYNIPGVEFFQTDATTLDGIDNESVESISALCSIEHFGLGRYGDPIDPEACFKAMNSIVRVLAPGGDAYIAVPIGWEHLEYNAHRIFYANTIVEAFKPLKLVEFSATDGNGIEYDVEIHKYDNERYNRGGRFGLFHFAKLEVTD